MLDTYNTTVYFQHACTKLTNQIAGRFAGFKVPQGNFMISALPTQSHMFGVSTCRLYKSQFVSLALSNLVLLQMLLRPLPLLYT